MKFLHAAAFAVVLTMAGSPALRAQEPDQDKDKPKQQQDEKKKPDAKEKEKPQPKPDARDDRDKTRTEADRDKAPRQEDRNNNRQQEQNSQRANQDRNDQRNANNGARNEQGGNRSAHRIPEERYRQSFGTEHHFRVQRRNDRRVEYGGYAFEYVDEWPAEWSSDDDVYIVLDGDDYYLVSVNHPGIRLRLMVVE